MSPQCFQRVAGAWPLTDRSTRFITTHNKRLSGRGFETRGYRVTNPAIVVRGGIEPGTFGFEVQRHDHSATLPPQ